jgi:hypothetical protein
MLPQGAGRVALEGVEEYEGDQPCDAQPGGGPIPNLECLGNGEELAVEVENRKFDKRDSESEELISDIERLR